jgi:hypothetical protein
MSESESAVLIENNKDLYELILNSKYYKEGGNAIQLLRTLDTERPEYLNHVDDVLVIRKLSLKEFNKVCGDYNDMSEEERRNLLYRLGFDTEVLPCKVFTTVEKVAGDGLKVDEMIVGQERLDKSWINHRDGNGVPYSSPEARDTFRDLKDQTRAEHFRHM